MSYKLPSLGQLIKDAETYSTQSINYTFDYSGWEDESGTNRKKDRIFYGRFGQEWLYRFCKLNELKVDKDNTSEKENDKFDLIISRHIVDVKNSISEGFIGQVSPGCYKNEKTHFYCFLLTDRELSYVEPLGFISAGDFKKKCFFVAHDEYIRNTGMKNKFIDGSYFVDRDKLVDFYMSIEVLRAVGDIAI